MKPHYRTETATLKIVGGGGGGGGRTAIVSIHVCMYVCVCEYIHMHIHAYIYVCVYVYIKNFFICYITKTSVRSSAPTEFFRWGLEPSSPHIVGVAVIGDEL